MEFLILSPSLAEHRKRERIIMQAVMEAAENLGITRIVKRRCGVLTIGVYVVDGSGKKLLYNDWEKKWGQDEIYESIMSSLRSFHNNRKSSEIILTIS